MGQYGRRLKKVPDMAVGRLVAVKCGVILGIAEIIAKLFEQMCVQAIMVANITNFTQFNNREIAIVFWLLLVFVWYAFNQERRTLLLKVIKAFFQRKIVTVVLILGVYVSGITYLLARLGIWNLQDHLKDTIVWTIMIAFAMVVKVASISRLDGFFRAVVKDVIRFTILLEFIVGLYPFNLFVELILIPVFVMLGAIKSFAENKPDHARLAKAVEWIIAILGMVILFHAVRGVISEAESLLNIQTLVDLLLPSILTILSLPFVYLIALLFIYENVFMRLTFQNKDKKLIAFAKRRAFLFFGFNLWKIRDWSKTHIKLQVNSKEAVLVLFRD